MMVVGLDLLKTYAVLAVVIINSHFLSLILLPRLSLAKGVWGNKQPLGYLTSVGALKALWSDQEFVFSPWRVFYIVFQVLIISVLMSRSLSELRLYIVPLLFVLKGLVMTSALSRKYGVRAPILKDTVFVSLLQIVVSVCALTAMSESNDLGGDWAPSFILLLGLFAITLPFVALPEHSEHRGLRGLEDIVWSVFAISAVFPFHAEDAVGVFAVGLKATALLLVVQMCRVVISKIKEQSKREWALTYLVATIILVMAVSLVGIK